MAIFHILNSTFDCFPFVVTSIVVRFKILGLESSVCENLTVNKGRPDIFYPRKFYSSKIEWGRYWLVDRYWERKKEVHPLRRCYIYRVILNVITSDKGNDNAQSVFLAVLYVIRMKESVSQFVCLNTIWFSLFRNLTISSLSLSLSLSLYFPFLFIHLFIIPLRCNFQMMTASV